jgi:hypothetical protein
MLSHTRFLTTSETSRWSRSPCRITSTTKDKSLWMAAPCFTVMKKDSTLWSIADFRIKQRINVNLFPFPRSNNVTKPWRFHVCNIVRLKIWDTIIELTPNASRLCTVVLPWGKYEYLRLPMGLCNSPDIFKRENEWSHVWPRVCSRLYRRPLNNFTGDFADHRTNWNKFSHVCLLADSKSMPQKFFGREQLEYLGYWITRAGINLLVRKSKLSTI